MNTPSAVKNNTIAEKEIPLIFPSPFINVDSYGYNSSLSYLIVPLYIMSFNSLATLSECDEGNRIFETIYKIKNLNVFERESSRFSKCLEDVLNCCDKFLSECSEEKVNVSDSPSIESIIGCLILCLQNGSFANLPPFGNSNYTAISNTTSTFWISTIKELQFKIKLILKVLREENSYDNFLVNYFVNVNAKTLVSINYSDAKFRQLCSLLVTPYNENVFKAKTLDRESDLQLLAIRRKRRLDFVREYCTKALEYSELQITENDTEEDFIVACDPEIKIDLQQHYNSEISDEEVLNVDSMLPYKKDIVTYDCPSSLKDKDYHFRFNLSCEFKPKDRNKKFHVIKPVKEQKVTFKDTVDEQTASEDTILTGKKRRRSNFKQIKNEL